MRKSMVYKVLLSISTILLIGGSVVVSQALGNKENKKQEQIGVEEKKITELMERVTRTTLLREPNYHHQKVKEEVKLPYIYEYLEKEDYSLIKITPKKIICEVTDKISFVSSTPCYVKVIANQVFLDYQKAYFNTTQDLEFKDFEVNGSICKNDGFHYYCLLKTENQTVKTFSYIETAFQTEENIIIYEYYLKINTDSIEGCLNFYPLSYCEEIKNYNLLELDNDMIIKKGVLFKHSFKKVEEDKYFLESSIVV